MVANGDDEKQKMTMMLFDPALKQVEPTPLLPKQSQDKTRCVSPTIRPRSPGLRVRFEDSPSDYWQCSCQVHDVDPMTMWFHQADYINFRRTCIEDARQVIRQCRQSKNRAVGSIRKAYEKFKDSSSTTNDVMSLEQDSSLIGMEVNYHNCINVIGIEKLLAKETYHDKKRRRLCILNAVHEIQTENFPTSMRPDVLRQLCHIISGPSRLFAEYLGAAAAASLSTFPTSSGEAERFL